MNDDFEFIEDRTFLEPLKKPSIPENSIEGWFYKKFPGSIVLKKFILLIIIIGLFVLSGIFLLLSRDTSSVERSVGLMDTSGIL